MNQPIPEQLKEARLAAGLTQTQAADAVGAKLRTWQDWEGGIATMPAGLWELFQIKTQPITCPNCKKDFTLYNQATIPAPRGPRTRSKP